MLNIDNKFEIGQEVYVIQKVKPKNICSACNGESYKIIDDNRFACTKCWGDGWIRGKKKIYKVLEGIKTITAIKLYSNDTLSEIKYNLRDEDNSGSFESVEKYLFATKEEAEVCCKELNEELEIPKLNTSPLGSDVIEETFWQK